MKPFVTPLNNNGNDLISRNEMKEPVGEKIIGTWKLVSWVYKNARNETVDFFGDNPVGILMYDRSGYMNAQLMRGDRPNISAAGLGEGLKEEIETAYKTYAAYFGKYRERSPGELVHTVEGSLFPNWVGHDEIRYAEITGDALVLSAPPVKIEGNDVVFYVTWRRV